MTDDLFTPTIRTPTAPATPPWRPESIVYPAFFGGALAATVLGAINAHRLSLGRGPVLAIVAAGLVLFAGRVAFAATIGGNTGRIGGIVAGLLTWGVVNAVQRKPFRAYLQNDWQPASLVGPGILAAIGSLIVEVIVIAVAR